MSDFRDVAGHYQSVLKDVDKRKMTAKFTFINQAGEELEHTVRVKFEVCETCSGRGAYVNPSIDAHGISADEWAEWDSDDREAYMNGRYDIPCAVCKGERVVAVLDENDQEIVKAFQQAEDDAWDYAREVTRERNMGY